MKIYKTLFLGLGLIALSSCSDFLNQTSPSELDNESTFNNAYYTELALNKVYGSLTYQTALYILFQKSPGKYP